MPSQKGVISLNEFRYNPDLKVGDEVEVLIDIREDKTGQLVLSHRKARTIMAWDRVNEAHDKEEIVHRFCQVQNKRWYDCRRIWYRGFLAWFADRC